MQTTAVHRDVQVSGIGVSVRSAGPALSGARHVAIVVTVSGADGEPRAGLAVADFGLHVLARGAEGVRARAAALARVDEPLAGVYVLNLEHVASARAHDAFACVVDVRAAGARGGPVARTVVALEG